MAQASIQSPPGGRMGHQVPALAWWAPCPPVLLRDGGGISSFLGTCPDEGPVARRWDPPPPRRDWAPSPARPEDELAAVCAQPATGSACPLSWHFIFGGLVTLNKVSAWLISGCQYIVSKECC